jgi:hypothetical protein
MPPQDIRSYMSPHKAIIEPTDTPARLAKRRNRVVESDSSDRQTLRQNGGPAGQQEPTIIDDSSSDDMYVFASKAPNLSPAPRTDQVSPRHQLHAAVAPQHSTIIRQAVQQRPSVQPPKPKPTSLPLSPPVHQQPKRQRQLHAEAEESEGLESGDSCDESGESAREQYRSSILAMRSRPAALHQVIRPYQRIYMNTPKITHNYIYFLYMCRVIAECTKAHSSAISVGLTQRRVLPVHYSPNF